jgi:hypothetical protein
LEVEFVTGPWPATSSITGTKSQWHGVDILGRTRGTLTEPTSSFPLSFLPLLLLDLHLLEPTLEIALRAGTKTLQLDQSMEEVGSGS